MALTIKILRDECIMSGLCVDEAPNTLELDDEGIPVVTKQNGDDDEALVAAAETCPVGCIVLTDASGKVRPAA